MNFPEAIFKIIEDNKCPLYTLGDEFKLSGKALLLENREEKTFITTSVIKIPSDKPACRILVEDITAVLIKYESMNNVHRCVINCSGCSGIIRLEFKQEKRIPSTITIKKREDDISALVSLLYLFPIFQTLDDHDIQKIVPLLKLKKYSIGEDIIRKGDPGSNLFILISGRVEVLIEDGASLGYLERGEVFGEISLLVGTPAGATIRVVKPARVLYVTGRDFKNILSKFPSLQMYFARLLAERLAKTNVERDEDLGSGMTGKLTEMPPSELMQTMNLNHKTGVLTLNLPKGPAKAMFREGGIIGAQYDGKTGKEAFFEILSEKKGRFKFTQGLPAGDGKAPELGDFMWLLMEGIRRVDEAEEKKEATG